MRKLSFAGLEQPERWDASDHLGGDTAVLVSCKQEFFGNILTFNTHHTPPHKKCCE
jgi:hypothetical protein